MPDTIATALDDADAALAGARAAQTSSATEAAKLPPLANELTTTRAAAASLLKELDRRQKALEVVLAGWPAQLASAQAAVAKTGEIGDDRTKAAIAAAVDEIATKQKAAKLQAAYDAFVLPEDAADATARQNLDTAQKAFDTARKTADDACAALAKAEAAVLGVLRQTSGALKTGIDAADAADAAAAKGDWPESYVLAQEAAAARAEMTGGTLNIAANTLVATARKQFTDARTVAEDALHAQVEAAIALYDKRVIALKASIARDAKDDDDRRAGAAAAVVAAAGA